VYFSLLTLELAAMLYAVSFRWTEVTRRSRTASAAITRPTLLGLIWNPPPTITGWSHWSRSPC